MTGESGRKHVEPSQFRLMTACSEICRTSAHFVLMNSPHRKYVCRECAGICTERPRRFAFASRQVTGHEMAVAALLGLRHDLRAHRHGDWTPRVEMAA
ncbi:hypothetical protein BH11PSE4_BH11PSE4_09000 [soil metagenome]